jgi:hypothetical protein
VLVLPFGLCFTEEIRQYNKNDWHKNKTKVGDSCTPNASRTATAKLGLEGFEPPASPETLIKLIQWMGHATVTPQGLFVLDEIALFSTLFYWKISSVERRQHALIGTCLHCVHLRRRFKPGPGPKLAAELLSSDGKRAHYVLSCLLI